MWNKALLHLFILIWHSTNVLSKGNKTKKNAIIENSFRKLLYYTGHCYCTSTVKFANREIHAKFCPFLCDFSLLKILLYSKTDKNTVWALMSAFIGLGDFVGIVLSLAEWKASTFWLLKWLHKPSYYRLFELFNSGKRCVLQLKKTC